MKKDTKMIRVVSRGFVNTSRGRVISPIITPYKESVNRIWSMLTVDRADVEEKLPDGSFIKLNIQNYDKDNTIKADVATGAPSSVVEPPKEPEVPENNQTPVEEQKVEVPAEEKVEEPKKEETPEVPEEVEPAEPISEEVSTDATPSEEDAEIEEDSEEEDDDSNDGSPVESGNTDRQSRRKNKKRNRNRQNNVEQSTSNSLEAPIEEV